MRNAITVSWLCLAIFQIAGCGKIPLISENRKNFPPWEKCPEQGGLRYVEKFVRDPGHDPIYLALMSYESDTDLELVVNTFGLIQSSLDKESESRANNLTPKPSWFPLKNAKTLYVFPESFGQGYSSNLWVDPDSKMMLLERTWW
ncbi:hypothetical protein [Schlesneria sp. T3-172]|uniref:hypothetical protein n=2 Tax=Schlesneria TaxID=656899 RepID=UPI0037CA24A4